MSTPAQPRIDVFHPILVMGDSQAGKTTFQGAMMCPRQLTIRGQYQGRPKIFTQSDETHMYLTDAMTALSKGCFPPATHGFTDLSLRLHVPPSRAGAAERAVVLRFLDFEGELHTTRLDPAQEMHKRLIDAVLDARGIVYLFDLASYFAVTPEEAARRGVVLRANIDTFASEAERRGVTLPDGRLPIRVALTITKGERYLSSPEELRLKKRLLIDEDGRAALETEPGAPSAYCMEHEGVDADARDLEAVEGVLASYEPHGSNMLDILRQFFVEVTVHVASAVGMVRQRELWMPNIRLERVVADDGAEYLVERVRDVNAIRPIGLFDPIVHLLDGAEVQATAAPPAAMIPGPPAAPTWTPVEEPWMEAAPRQEEPQDFSDLAELDPEPSWKRYARIASVAVPGALVVSAIAGLTLLLR